jgi:hypothetical protein
VIVSLGVAVIDESQPQLERVDPVRVALILQ